MFTENYLSHAQCDMCDLKQDVISTFMKSKLQSLTRDLTRQALASVSATEQGRYQISSMHPPTSAYSISGVKDVLQEG